MAFGLLDKSTWIMVGIFYTAQTGINYRRYKKGVIDKKEFWRRLKLNSVTTVGSLAGGSGGAAAGFALGSLIFPGVGSIIGAVVGGVAGGIAGEKISAKAYKSIEERIQIAKQIKAQEAIHYYDNPISDERIEEALTILGLSQFTMTNEGCKETTMEEVEQAYLYIIEHISEQKMLEQ